MQLLILGDGRLGGADRRGRGRRAGPRRPRRPPAGRHGGAADGARCADVVVDASRRDAVAANVADALDAGGRRVRHRDDRLGRGPTPAVERAAPASTGRRPSSRRTFSLGVALFGRLVETAAELLRRRSARSIRTSSSGTGAARPTGRRAPRGRSRGASRPATRAGRPGRRPGPARRRPARARGRRRSAPAPRPGCTSSASTPPARRSSSASPPATARPTPPAPSPPPTG